MRRHRIARSFAVVVLGLALAAVPMSAEAGTRKGGNAPSAKACQKGGWQDRAPSEDPTNAFDSEEACTSYAAEGGTIVAVQQASITITFHQAESPYYCWVDGHFNGLAANTEYYVRYYRLTTGGNDAEYAAGNGYITTDADGNAGGTFPYWEKQAYVRLAIDGVATSDYTLVGC